MSNFMEKSEGYLHLARSLPDRFFVVDGLGEADDIEILIWNEIHSRFFGRLRVVHWDQDRNPNLALLKRFSEGRLHHGLIFQGDPIDSVRDRAFELLKVILNMQEGSKEHPDLFHLRPSGKMRIITVEKTRSMISDLYRTSNQGGAKVAVIHEADRMRKEAANALKTSEEPLRYLPDASYKTDQTRCFRR